MMRPQPLFAFFNFSDTFKLPNSIKRSKTLKSSSWPPFQNHCQSLMQRDLPLAQTVALAQSVALPGLPILKSGIMERKPVKTLKQSRIRRLERKKMG